MHSKNLNEKKQYLLHKKSLKNHYSDEVLIYLEKLYLVAITVYKFID